MTDHSKIQNPEEEYTVRRPLRLHRKEERVHLSFIVRITRGLADWVVQIEHANRAKRSVASLTVLHNRMFFWFKKKRIHNPLRLFLAAFFQYGNPNLVLV